MGEYVKTMGDLVLMKYISIIHTSKDINMVEATKWLKDAELEVKSIKEVENGMEFILNAPKPICILSKWTITLQAGIKATCYKVAYPFTIEFDTKRFRNEKSIDEWLKLHSLNLDTNKHTKNKVYLKGDWPTDLSKAKSKEVDKGVTFHFIEKLSDNREEKSMRKTILDKPRRFMFHAELAIVPTPKLKGAKAAEDDFMIEGFASTGEVDRDDDIVEPKAFEKALDLYMENAVICYMHDWERPIGVATFVKIVKAGESIGGKKSATGGLYIKAYISKAEPEIRTKIKEGVLKAFSIGFQAKNAEWDDTKEVQKITDMELFEVSVVTIPSNRRSLFSMSKAFELGTDLVCVECKDAEHKEGEVCCSKVSEPELNESFEKFKARIVDFKKSGKKLLTFNDEPELQVLKKAFDIKEEYTKVAGVDEEPLNTTTNEVIGEYEPHEHEVEVICEEDEDGNIVSCEGMAKETLGHSHPISKLGVTETVEGHSHKFNIVEADDDEDIEDANEDDDEGEMSKTVDLKDYILTKKGIEKISNKNVNIARFIAVEDHEQKVLSNAYGYFELSLYAKGMQAVFNEDSWTIIKTYNWCNWKEKLKRVVYAYLETGREKKEELLIDGYLHIKNKAGDKIAIHMSQDYGCWSLNWYYADKQSQVVASLINKLDKWVDDNNFYKGEKISYNGEFLPINDIDFDAVKLPEDKKQAIKLGALDFFEKAELYKKNGIPHKRGMIWSGEPGTGKTMTGKVLLSKCGTKPVVKHDDNIAIKNLDKFAVVEKGILSRSGQPDLNEFKAMQERGLKSVISLRETVDTSDELGDDAQIPGFTDLGLKYLQIPIKDLSIPTDKQVKQFLDFVGNAENQPCLVHCRKGGGRTGIMAAIYRYENNNYTMEKAIEEAETFGKGIINAKQKEYLMQYAEKNPKTQKAKCTFIWITASDLRYGSSAKGFFAMARKLAPAILFMEDTDEFLMCQSSVDSLKTEMDGLKSNDGIVTILCTNFPDRIPKALLDRPSRFDEVIKFELPNEELRYEILSEHSKNVHIENKSNVLKDIAKCTEGFSGAHLKELIVYSILLAMDEQRSEVTSKDLDNSLKKMKNTRELITTISGRKSHKLEIENKSLEVMNKFKKMKSVTKALAPEHSYKIPKDILEEMLELAVQQDEPSTEKMLGIVLYMEDLLSKGTKVANTRYYARQIEKLFDDEDISADELVKRFEVALKNLQLLPEATKGGE